VEGMKNSGIGCIMGIHVSRDRPPSGCMGGRKLESRWKEEEFGNWLSDRHSLLARQATFRLECGRKLESRWKE
jgi:hypothetical protein